MSKTLSAHDIILKDDRILSVVSDAASGDGSVVFADEGGRIVGLDIDLSVDKALGRLKADPALGARFLSRTEGNGDILWAGSYSSSLSDGRSLGVKILDKRDGAVYVGDNELGRMLARVRSEYREWIRTAVLDEAPVPAGQVVVDFTQKGEDMSDIARREADGAQYIHVDDYTPARFRFDAGRDGTTGHSRRDSDADVEFHSFVCPFGTSWKSPIRVESAAEASYLYEKALRGDLDWKNLFDGLRRRGLVGPQTRSADIAKLVARYSAQFDWMREQVCTDTSLRGRHVVASSAMVDDSSMGRSIYDPVLAPSPAHVLAHYISNPGLLYSPSEYLVSRALSAHDRSEPQKLSVAANGIPEGGTVNILVIGSDTIGGRIPGRKASSGLVMKDGFDANGRRILTPEKTVTIPMKSGEEVEADYEAFRTRLDEVLSGIPEGVNVRLVSGSASTLGDTVGLGTPRMVERYVKEKGGIAGTWDFVRHELTKVSGFGETGRYTAVSMEHFAECLPVLAGRRDRADIVAERPGRDEDLSFSFSSRDFGVCESAVCFSVAADRRNDNVLALASYVSGSMPVVHVQDVKDESTQADDLRAGAVLSLSSFSSGDISGESLFDGEIRTEWDVTSPGQVNDLSFTEPETGFTIPVVAEPLRTPVSVDGVRFNTVLGIYAGLAAKAVGADRKTFLDIAAGEMSLAETVRSLPVLDPEVEENLMKQAVRLASGEDSDFSRRLMELDGRPVLCRSSVDAGRLFTDVDGHGENRFGVVLSDEGRRLREVREAFLRTEEEERRRALEENGRRQKTYVQSAAEGEKVAGGLPRNLDESRGAVWFLGTGTPDALAFPGERKSFAVWDDNGGSDRLNREKAGAPTTPGPEGDDIPNDLVFLFPSNLLEVTGRKSPSFMPDSMDLTGVTRPDPLTGRKMDVAFGVPVKNDFRFNEPENEDGFRCSFRLDNDSSAFLDSVILADALARSQAHTHSMRLCIPGRARMNGRLDYHLGMVFSDKIYAYNRKSGVKEWMPNPHRAPANASIVSRYISMLERGADYPLNCIPLPSGDYSFIPGSETSKNEARVRFIADLNMSLKVANSAAVAMGVPLRFPLGEDGRVDLGPGVPEEFRAFAEERIDSFIGVVKKEDILTRGLPELRTVPFYESASKGLRNTGSQVLMRPSELVSVFGLFESDSMIADGQDRMPLHRVDLVMKDSEGNDVYFSLRDSKTTKGMTLKAINESLRYEANPVCSFIIHSNRPDMVQPFKAALNGYVERAKVLDVEWRVIDGDGPDSEGFSLDGYVDVRPSWEYEIPSSSFEDHKAHSVGRPVDRSGAAWRIDGSGEQDEYAGKVRARDGFSGYVQVRWTLSNGKQSDWTTLGNSDLDLAKDIVMKSIGRDYPHELGRAVPEDRVIDMQVRSVAVRMAGEDFRKMRYISPGKHVKEDGKVVEIERSAPVEKDVVSDLLPVSVEGPETGPVIHEESGKAVEPDSPAAAAGDDLDILFSESAGGYAQRTRENADADGVDFTLQFAVNFDTAGERCTAKAAGDSLIPVPMPVLKGGGLDLSPGAVSGVVDSICGHLPDDFFSGERCGFNVAGNGIYTLASGGVTQEQCDEFVTRVLSGLRDRGVDVSLVRSGGQSGIDEAAAAAAVALGIPCEVHAPKGWLMRDVKNSDVSGEEPFKERFENKDYETLRSLTQMKEGYGVSGMDFDGADRPVVRVSEHVGPWTRKEAEGHPDVLYVFTDNTDRDSGKNVIDRNSGYYREYGNGRDDLHFPGVTSAVLRGLDNAVPVSTQRWYHDGAKGEGGRWTDKDAKEFREVVSSEFSGIREKVMSGRYTDVVFPEGGLFGGKISAITKERTPKLHAILEKELKSFRTFISEYNGESVAVKNVPVRKNSSSISL